MRTRPGSRRSSARAWTVPGWKSSPKRYGAWEHPDELREGGRAVREKDLVWLGAALYLNDHGMGQVVTQHPDHVIQVATTAHQLAYSPGDPAYADEYRDAP